MIIFLQLNIPLGLPAGKYLVKSEHLEIPGIQWGVAQENGLLFIREATYDEVTRFIEEEEGGKNQIVCLQYL